MTVGFQLCGSNSPMALIVCVGSRSGFFVSYSLSFVWRQVFSFSLDLVKLTDVFQGLSRQLTLVCLVPVVELATGMDQVTDFSDAAAEAGLVTRVIVADQLALPVTQKSAGVLARPGWSEVVNNDLQVRERCGAVSPDVGLVGFLFARSQHANRSFIGMQNAALQQGVSQRIHQGLQLHTAGTHPFGQGGAWDFETGATEDGVRSRKPPMLPRLYPPPICA